MAYFLQQLINGIALGSIYGLIAIGYTMVYGIIGMINFAHGDIFMVGAFIALIAFLALLAIGVTAIPLALLIVLIIAMLLTAVWGWTVERIAYRPLRESFRLAPLITAIGMSIVLYNFVQVTQGARVKPLPPQIPGGVTLVEGMTENGPIVVQLSYMQMIIILTTLVLAFGLGVTVFSDLPSLRIFGFVCGTTLIASLIADLVFLPGLIMLVRKVWRHRVVG